MKKGFTLMELVIVIGIIALLGAAALALLNPVFQIKKSWDSKRKAELSTLQKVLEDWYGDKNCYPKPSEICYNDSPTPDADGTYTCNICGKAPTIRSLSPYISQLACDPQYPSKKYLYQTDKDDCPTWYRIYTILSNTSDPVIAEVGCQNGCGPSSPYSYNYGVSSPNIGLESNNNLCSLATVVYINPFCNICGTYSVCKIIHPDEIYYTDPGSCTNACIKD